MHTILLIDDDERLASLLSEYFARYDLKLISETHPIKGIKQAQNNDAIDLIILDIMLPDMDGFEVCRTIRKSSDIPVLMLTARGEVMDRIIGLEIGADDYLSKPFESRELVARIHRILKRTNQNEKDNKEQNEMLQWGELKIDKARYLASFNQVDLNLTGKEYELLLLLAENPDKSFDRDEIMNKLTGIDAELFSRSIDILVSRLRNKLNIRIIIRGPDLKWSSDGTFLHRLEMHFKHHPNKIGRYESGTYRRNFVLRIENPPYLTTFVTNNNSDLPSPCKLLLNTLLGILLVLTLLYFLLRRMISPLQQIKQSIKRIGSGELEHRIENSRTDEFGDLSSEINAMADDINNMLEAKRQLLLAISHELRSPITRTKVALSLMEDSSLKNEIEENINEMEIMITELLEAERLNHRHQSLNLEKTDINQEISDVIEKHHAIAPILQKLDHTIPMQILDESRFHFVIKNLIDNALKHRKNTEDKITITTYQNKTHWSLSVEDQGKGIPKKDIPAVTEPFYRADSSRQRETGGFGLGLYITKMIIEAHHGELAIDSKENIGTTITLPLSGIAVRTSPSRQK